MSAADAKDGIFPGPWFWRVNEKTKSAMLVDSHTNLVMGFGRWGTQSAQPVFNINGIMYPAKELLAAVPEREHHRDWHADVDHPTARLIAAAPTLLARVEAMGAVVAAAQALVDERVGRGTVVFAELANALGDLKLQESHS